MKMKIPPPDPRVDSEKYRDHWLPMFERAARSPRSWLSTGRSLQKAADRLRPEIEGFFESVRADKLGDAPPEDSLSWLFTRC